MNWISVQTGAEFSTEITSNKNSGAITPNLIYILMNILLYSTSLITIREVEFNFFLLNFFFRKPYNIKKTGKKYALCYLTNLLLLIIMLRF